MKSAAIAAGGLALLLGLAACTGNADPGNEPEDDGAESSKEAPPPEAPGAVDFAAPEGFTLDPEIVEADVPTLSDTYELQTYMMDGASQFDRISVYSFLLPPGTATDSAGQQTSLIESYDGVIDNADAGAVNLALINGEKGHFRRAQFVTGSDDRVQDNYFLFDGLLAVQVSCEYTEDTLEAVYEACWTVLEDLTLSPPN